MNTDTIDLSEDQRHQIEKAVKEGIQFLEGKGIEWKPSVGNSRFDMASGNHCLLAHACQAPFPEAKKRLGLSKDGAVFRGFDLPRGMSNYGNYQYLTFVWREALHT